MGGLSHDDVGHERVVGLKAVFEEADVNRTLVGGQRALRPTAAERVGGLVMKPVVGEVAARPEDEGGEAEEEGEDGEGVEEDAEGAAHGW